MKFAVILVSLIVSVNGGISGGGGERRSQRYVIRNDRITFSPSGYARGKDYIMLAGPQRFMESATPVIYFVIPSRIEKGTSPEAGIGGDHFLTFPVPPRVFIGEFEAENVRIFGSTSILFRYPHGLSEGIYDLKVLNPDGRTAVLKGGVEVYIPPPVVYSIIPQRIFEGERRFLYVTGNDFSDGITGTLGSYPFPVSFVDANHIFIEVSGLGAGNYDLHLFNPDGGSSTFKSAVQVVRRSMYSKVSEGCGCAEGAYAGDFIIFSIIFILFFFKRRSALAMVILLLLSCGGSSEHSEFINNPPVAVAGSAVSARVYEWIRLDGRNSYDPDGDTLEFSWYLKKFPDRAVYYFFDNVSSTPSFMTETPGVYEFELVVSDGYLLSSPSSLTVTVSGEGVLPEPCFEIYPDRTGRIAQMNSSCSYAQKREGLVYQWEMIDPPRCQSDVEIPPLPNPSFPVQCPRGTKYEVALTLLQGKYQSYPFRLTMVVPDSPPILPSIDDLHLPSGTSSWMMSAGSVHDSDGDNISCRWSIIYSNLPITPEVSYSCTQNFEFSGDGTFILGLEVNDGILSVEDYVTIKIGSPYPPSISDCAVNVEPLLSEDNYSAEVFISCPLSVSGWSGNPSLIKYRWIVEDYPEGATLVFPSSSEGWLSSYSLPITFLFYINGIVKNVNYEPLSYSVRLILESDEDGHRFITDRRTKGTFNIPNALPSIYVEDYSFWVDDAISIQGYPVNLRGRDPDGDSLTYYLSFIFTPPYASAYLGGSSGSDERVFYAGFYGDKRGVYILRAVVEDEHGTSAFKDFSITLK